MRGDGVAVLNAALERHGCKRGSDRSFQCPAHQDRSPSLSVSQGETGALLRCHAGCEPKDILDALGLGWPDLFDDPREGGAGEGSTPPKSGATVQHPEI